MDEISRFKEMMVGSKFVGSEGSHLESEDGKMTSSSRGELWVLT